MSLFLWLTLAVLVIGLAFVLVAACAVGHAEPPEREYDPREDRDRL